MPHVAGTRQTRLAAKAQGAGFQGIQSVSRALSILELFSDKRPSLSVSQVAELTGLNRATCYRFCQTLRQLGYLEELDDRRFRPGLKAVSLAYSALSSRELPELALPYLRQLRKDVNETVNMGLLDDTEVVYVARVLSDHLISLRLYVGSRLPAYASSLGRAQLAFLPEDEAEDIIERSRRVPLTEHTIVERRRLSSELRRIRRQGYAVNDQEIADGLRGVAAPVLAESGRPIAAINISIPRPLREPGEIEDVLAPQVMETARAIGALAAKLAIERG
jgi:PcaR/PcaU/PobR family beta-ketoadipate pathway transcriptional regulator